MSELKRALAGSEKGVMATLVREAAAPLHEQEAEAEALREEVARQTARVSEVRRHIIPYWRSILKQLDIIVGCWRCSSHWVSRYPFNHYSSSKLSASTVALFPINIWYFPAIYSIYPIPSLPFSMHCYSIHPFTSFVVVKTIFYIHCRILG